MNATQSERSGACWPARLRALGIVFALSQSDGFSADPGSASRSEKLGAVDDRDGAIGKAMASVRQAAERVAHDPTRPIYHLLPPANWNNDPNGPLYYRGYYHLFYQHNPYGDQWASMHWGHWRSKDLVKWEHQPIALWPSLAMGEEHCFSGCATVNDRGEPMIFYTSIGNRDPECWIALPEDDQLIRWKKYLGNPVLSQSSPNVKYYDFRDPYIFRHEGRVYMVHGGNLNQGKGGQACVSLYEAENPELTKWRFKSILFTDPQAGNIECPNFFPLGGKFVLITSPHRKCDYFIGAFDAQAGKFTPETRGVLDYGDFYAPNTFVDPKGRHLMWGWVNGYQPGRGWTGCMTVPRVLSLRDGKLIQQPAPELEQLRRGVTGVASLNPIPELKPYFQKLGEQLGDALELRLAIDMGQAPQAVVRLRCSADGQRAVTIRYLDGVLDVAGVKVPFALPAAGPKVKLRLFLDRSLLEVYANDGETCVTRVVDSRPDDKGLEFLPSDATIRLTTMEWWPMNSIW